MEELKKGQTLITTGIYFFKKKRILIIFKLDAFFD